MSANNPACFSKFAAKVRLRSSDTITVSFNAATKAYDAIAVPYAFSSKLLSIFIADFEIIISAVKILTNNDNTK